MPLTVAVDRARIEEFCRRWKVKELSIFGSALRDDFRPESDLDILVALGEDADWDLWDHIHAEDELRALFGRDVDLVEIGAVRNPFRRRHILSNREVLYAA